jgi:hypothetical protein
MKETGGDGAGWSRMDHIGLHWTTLDYIGAAPPNGSCISASLVERICPCIAHAG